MNSPSPKGRRVVLHVGTPKSGTTFLQKTLWRQREALRAAGVICPGANQREMFLAAIEVRGTHKAWGVGEEQLAGTWRRVCREARQFPGTTILSHELLAAADVDQVKRALAELHGLEVHLVVTARDLARQVVSEWQERIKNGSTSTFQEFQDKLLQQVAGDDYGSLFWRYQHLPDVLHRWGAELPPDHVHVVVPPRSSRDPAELWRLFGEAAGFDGSAISTGSQEGPANQSLGVTQIAILRSVNQALDGRIVQPAYAKVVKRYLAQALLTRYASPRPACPPDLWRVLRELSEQWIEEMQVRGYTVDGDLADLIPEDSLDEAVPPDEVDRGQQAEMSAAVIADLLVEVDALRTRLRRRPRATGSTDRRDAMAGWAGRVHRAAAVLRRWPGRDSSEGPGAPRSG